MAFALKFFTCLVLTLCIVASVDAAISCGIVSRNIAPCLLYLRRGGFIPDPCCAGVTKLNGMLQTLPDRQQACKCLESVSQGIFPSLASSLPGLCGLSNAYPISLTNCDNVE